MALLKSPLRPALPSFVTTYDVLKALAIVLMIADHIGFYFYPEDLWWRVFGRLCVPVWLYLIGYARSRTIDVALLGGAWVLVAVNALLGINFLPVSILWTIIILRLLLDPLMRWINQSMDRLFLVTLVALVLYPFSNEILEYGTLAIIFGISGHMMRHGFGPLDQKMPLIYAAIAAFLYAGTQEANFAFDLLQSLVLFAGIAGIMAALIFYLPQQATAIRNRAAVPVLHYLGRHSLLIYVVHLSVFKLAYLLICPCMKQCCCPALAIDFTRLLP